MNRKDLDALNELYLSVYDEEQLNEAPGQEAQGVRKAIQSGKSIGLAGNNFRQNVGSLKLNSAETKKSGRSTLAITPKSDGGFDANEIDKAAVYGNKRTIGGETYYRARLKNKDVFVSRAPKDSRLDSPTAGTGPEENKVGSPVKLIPTSIPTSQQRQGTGGGGAGNVFYPGSGPSGNITSYCGAAGGSGAAAIKELNKASGSWPLRAQFQARKSGTWVQGFAPVDVDYLVVAGGAGGGSRHGGGGGAGGYRTSFPGGTKISLSGGVSTPITVGAGGAGGAVPGCGNFPGSAGSNSSFGPITSNGGGGGGTRSDGNAGGSGGGAGEDNPGCGSSPPGGRTGGAGNTPPVSPPQGNAGGDYPASAYAGAAGGGGAGAVGGIGGPGGPKAGGTGSPNSISGSAVFYGGGGGGTAGYFQPGSPGGAGDAGC